MTVWRSMADNSARQKRSSTAQRLVEAEPESERVSAIEKDQKTTETNSIKNTGSHPKLASIPADGVPAA